MRPLVASGLVLALLTAAGASALADPCGMVPPPWEGEGPPITRVGVQQTYVFYKEGIESFVIRPGFSGKVDEFGMLIPFPSVPAIRKVDDEVFGHIAMAVEPPPLVVDLRPRPELARMAVQEAGGKRLDFERARDGGVTVLKEEAVGMYEVAVLAAGSAASLQTWMNDHGYRYPAGMDAVVADYVTLGWCFVAVKSKVGQKEGVTPHPGMRETNPSLPKGSTFDGNVQAMGFRFRTPKLVVPMRLSAFNAGRLDNKVYLLTDRPQKIEGIPESMVVTQIPGKVLRGHLTQLRPLKVLGGTIADITPEHLASLAPQREPGPFNGLAKILFAGDLEAVRLDSLSLPHEEQEKELLRIGERLGLRGEEIDALHRGALEAARAEAAAQSLGALDHMTLTVVAGDFPRETLAKDNLQFSEFVRQGLDASAFAAPLAIKGELKERIAERAPPLPRDAVPAQVAAIRSKQGMWGAIAIVLGMTALCVFVAKGRGV